MEDICAVTVNNPVIIDGLVKARLLAVQRVLMRGLAVVLMRGLVIGNIVMADTPLLYDQDSHRSEAIWHGEVERWRSETNTFHLANGELMITLEDVVVLFGLRVNGFVVTGSTRGDWMELARVLLGVELSPGSFHGGRLSLAWIRGRFLFCPDDVPDEVIQQHA
ncbi:hypothetical protein H6P81_002943 [Aristolochia fimbriata]|uniref:Aminotransferase-like plant mobile domain-containing protein n=1 Tax=Aristolochia fimbriata TaxID=158543 RepID=A0AAV7FB61_ARIFI|nr:hypothetical protein H6P81_002943 [Aristolochia fimbriata]